MVHEYEFGSYTVTITEGDETHSVSIYRNGTKVFHMGIDSNKGFDEETARDCLEFCLMLQRTLEREKK